MSDESISSVAEFLLQIRGIARASDRFVMFRGQGDASWDILPSIMRGGDRLLNAEKDISREIISQYPDEFDADVTMFDKLCRMQHFGVATRLLDVTTNPLVALYFATCVDNEAFGQPDGMVTYFDGPIARRKYYDSDTVSCIANLSNLTNEEKNTLSETSARTISEFNDLKPARRLLQFIKAEKPYFLPEIRREHLHTPFIVIPKLRNRRIIAQHGAFMIFGLDRNAGPKYKKDITAKKIIVSGESKEEIRVELSGLGITDATLFPEIDKASAHIMTQFRA